MITLCRPNRTVVTSFHPRQRHERSSGESVVALAQESSTNAPILVCALNNGVMKLYDRHTLRLVSTMQAETDVVHVGLSSSYPSVMVAASRNGIVMAFDIREKNQHYAPMNNPSGMTNGVIHQKVTDEGGTVNSMDICSESSTIALGGSEGIYLWDWRQPTNIALLGETHQNVTQVRFLQRNRLISTTDEILCLLDCSNTCEKALCIMYTGKSTVYKKMGFCGNERAILYCLSTDNIISLWNLTKGQCFHQTGIHSLRQKTLRSTNYYYITSMVDCSFDPLNQTLSLLASNYSGEAMIFSMSNTTTTTAPVGGHWQATQRLVGGHRGMVTAWTGNLTGGSDARVCEWMPSYSTSNTLGTMQPLLPTKRQRYDME